MGVFEFTIPTKIEFGIDILARLGHFVRTLGNRVLLVAENVVTQSGLVSKVENILKGKGIDPIVYDGIFPNADSKVIDEIALIARKSRVNVILGLGGSRACNIAKFVSFLCMNPGEISEYISGKEGNGKRVPYVEVTSVFREVYALTSSGFLTDAYDQVNKVVSLDGMGTDYLVIDPAIMSGIPLKTAIYIALDILMLCIEGYISLKVNPLLEPILLRGVETVYYNLAKYVKNPLDITLREKLCTAGLFTSISNIITGFGIGFALSMGMNGKNRLSKSVVSSILLPYVVEYNQSVVASRFVKIARVMGKDIEGREEQEAASLVIDGINEFKNSLGVDLERKFSQLGLQKDDLVEAAEVAVRFEDINSVPRKASFDSLMKILEKAF